MLPRAFIQKHKIKLNDAENKLARDAMLIMRESLDVNHNESHIYRILDYLDNFISDKEYKEYQFYIDLKTLVLAIIWHDTWKSERDPKSVLMLLPDMLWDGMGSASKFYKAATKSGLDKAVIKRATYIIRKHSIFQILPAKSIEAKLLQDLDALDCFSLDRIYLLEKKYLCDRPLNWPTLRLAQFAAHNFVEKKSEDGFFFQWTKNNFREKQKKVLDKIMPEINEYEQMLRLMDSEQNLEFERMYLDLKDKYLNRPEMLERPEDPF